RVGALVRACRGGAPRVRSGDRQEVPDAPYVLARPRDASLPPEASRAPAGAAVSWQKYSGRASGWSEQAYASTNTYLAHRAELVRSLGPPLRAGDIVLDLACGDGGLADHLPDQRYIGV